MSFPPQFITNSIPIFQPITATNRSILSTFRRSDVSYILTEDEKTSLLPQASNEGSDIIVIHPGSRYIKIGFANQGCPHISLNVIARKLYNPKPQPPDPKLYPFLSGYDYCKIQKETKEYINNHKEYIGECLESLKEDNTEYNKNSKVSEKVDNHDNQWFIPNEEPYVVGDDALRIPKELEYERHYPIYRRHFHLSECQSLITLTNDLETIFMTSCERELGVKRSELKNYSTVLIVPDYHNRQEIKHWFEVCFGCGFKSVLIVHESLAAIYGIGVGSACVVDIGSTQTTVSLVEDGYVIPETRQNLDYGLDHISPLYYTLLKEQGFPYELDFSNIFDVKMLLKMKEENCFFKEEVVNEHREIHIEHPRKPSKIYSFRTGLEGILSIYSLFHPHFLCLKDPLWYENFGEDCEEIVFERVGSWYNKKITESENTEECGSTLVPEKDGINENDKNIIEMIKNKNIPMYCGWYLEETDTTCLYHNKDLRKVFEHVIVRHLDNLKEEQAVCLWHDPGLPYKTCRKPFSDPHTFKSHIINHIMGDCETKNAPEPTERIDSKDDEHKEYIGLDEAILKSILKVESNKERIKKWLGSVLLVGGGSHIKGLESVLETRLRYLSKEYVNSSDRIGLITNIKETDPLFICWRGGCISSRLDGSTEYWITNKEWQTVGINSFLDRYTFINMEP